MKYKPKLLATLITCTIVFIASFITFIYVASPWWAKFIVYISIFIITGYPVIIKCLKNILRADFLDENFLMTIATIGAFAISEFAEGAAVMLFYQFGEWFQGYATENSRRSIKGLLELCPESATVLRNGEQIVCDPAEVEIGETIVVKAGERIAIDGILLSDTATIDNSSLTGESLPVNAVKNASLLSGGINLSGEILIKTTKSFENSAVSKILELVENMETKKAKPENFITKFAKYYTPIVVLLSVIIAIVPPIFNGMWQTWIYRALSFLVISCPCALVISVPLSFFGGIGGASKHGILIKGSSAIEALSKANTIVFDKTGTLTMGQFKVVKLSAFNCEESELLIAACMAEAGSNHPVAKAIMEHSANLNIPKTKLKITEIAGKGMIAENKNTKIICGNDKILKDYDINCEVTQEYGSIIHVAKNNKYLGYIVVSDVIKAESADVVSKLKKQNKRVVMLSGDNKKYAEHIAKNLNITEFYGELLPTNKVEKLTEIMQNGKVAFVGDGINDAPALLQADAGISMGGNGQDIAIESSSIVLMNDNLNGICTAINTSKKTMRIVWQNIIFALGVKAAVLILSAIGITNMWAAVFADVGVAVLAILNSMRCLKVKKEK